MTQHNDPRPHSGFASFPSPAARDRFVHTALDPDPELKARAYISGRRPTIVFEKLTHRERDEIVAALAGLGQWFDDIQFQPT